MYYEKLDYDQAELAAVMRKTYDEIIDFMTMPAFTSLCATLNNMDKKSQPIFVREIVLNPAELLKRGIEVPEGILLQLSAFGDRRPTLFAVKKYLPVKYHRSWENCNITIDSEYANEDISKEGNVAWRRPLPVDVQAFLMSEGIGLEEVSSEVGVQLGAFGGGQVAANP